MCNCGAVKGISPMGFPLQHCVQEIEIKMGFYFIRLDVCCSFPLHLINSSCVFM